MWGSEDIQQRQTSVNKEDIEPANVQILPMKEEARRCHCSNRQHVTSERLDRNIIGKSLVRPLSEQELTLLWLQKRGRAYRKSTVRGKQDEVRRDRI